MDLIKITRVTEMFGVSSRTLRYYEQVGLLRSERPPFEKYRYYDSENINRLRQILVLRAAGRIKTASGTGCPQTRSPSAGREAVRCSSIRTAAGSS